MSEIYGIYGASGFGKEILPILVNILGTNKHIYFIDDNVNSNCNILNDHKILTFEQFLDSKSSGLNVIIAIANSKIREILTRKCLENGIKLFDLKSTNSLILSNVSIDSGYILCPFVTLTSNIKIGKSFHANLYSYVAHDCVIGDYVTFAPGVKCNGNIHIQDHVYIGTGAIIKQGRPNKPIIIGKGAVIGAGAVVTKSILEYTTVIGNPARKLTKENIKSTL